MIILAFKTDQPPARLLLYQNELRLAELNWPAGRQLAETLHHQIEKLLAQKNCRLADLEGLVVFKGPGSFTGLRIGAAAANALAYGLGVAIVGTSGSSWLKQGLKLLLNGRDHRITVPGYGTPARTTEPKK